MPHTLDSVDYREFAREIHPLYMLNGWKIAKEPGVSELDYPTVERLADIARWAHETCLASELDDTYATTARIRVEKKPNSIGSHDYLFLLDVAHEFGKLSL